jgi:hypothetical protein
MAKKSTREVSAPVVNPVVNLHTLPVILTIPDMLAIYRIQESTIRHALARGEFRPVPFEKYPYRWRRDDVIRDLAGPSRKLRRRAHGPKHNHDGDRLATK